MPSVQRICRMTRLPRIALMVIRWNTLSRLARPLAPWCHQHFFNWPFVAQASPNRMYRPSFDFSPFCNTVRLSIERQVNILSCIARLCSLSSPTAVHLRIGAVVIYSLKFMLWRWPWGHIAHESPEIQPFRVNRNSTATIVCIPKSGRIRTALNHLPPHTIQRVFLTAIDTVRRAQQLSLLTATTLIAATYQITSSCLKNFSAGAQAKPVHRASPGRINVICGTCQNFEVREWNAQQIPNWWSHNQPPFVGRESVKCGVWQLGTETELVGLQTLATGSNYSTFCYRRESASEGFFSV